MPQAAEQEEGRMERREEPVEAWGALEERAQGRGGTAPPSRSPSPGLCATLAESEGVRRRLKPAPRKAGQALVRDSRSLEVPSVGRRCRRVRQIRACAFS